MSNVIECRSWNDLVEAFRTEKIFVNVQHADKDLISEFVKALNDAGILFPSRRVGEMPYNQYMYYLADYERMYTCHFPGLNELKDRTCVDLRDAEALMFAVQEVDHECLDALL